MARRSWPADAKSASKKLSPSTTTGLETAVKAMSANGSERRKMRLCDGQKTTMAWDWLSPIPGTLHNSQYRLKQSGMSPLMRVGSDPPRSASPIVALEEVAAARLDIAGYWASTARANIKALSSAEIFGNFRRFEIAREIAVRLALLQVRA